MSRFFVGNFDFERTLTVGNSTRSSPAFNRVEAELVPAWIAIAEEGDCLLCPETVDFNFFDTLTLYGFPQIQLVSGISNRPVGLQLVPWGWSPEIVRWGRSIGTTMDAPPLDAVKTVNSRYFSHRLEQERGVELPGAAVATSLTELFAAIDRLPSPQSGCVVKAEFSNASRERFLQRPHEPSAGVRSEAHGPDVPIDRDALSRWAARRFARGQALFVEPWVERVDEAGVQLTIPHIGRPRVEGVTRLLVDGSGRYRGSEFTPALDVDDQWQDAVETALDVAGVIQEAGYFGPLGIDAMRYRDQAGETRLRPLQDINARWTMGRLSLGLRRLLRPGERGTWLHGPQAASDGETEDPSSPNIRRIATSPESIGGLPVHLKSVIEIAAP